MGDRKILPSFGNNRMWPEGKRSKDQMRGQTPSYKKSQKQKLSGGISLSPREPTLLNVLSRGSAVSSNYLVCEAS